MRDEPLEPMIRVEVVYAERDRQVLRTLLLPSGSTAAQAIETARILQTLAEGHGAPVVGIFGRVVQPDEVLSDGDRVELYRPLLLDPKEARRQRAKSGSRI